MVNQKQEKILIYAAIIIVCIILFITVILIWKPLFISITREKINKYDNTVDYGDEMGQYYKDYLTENLKVINFDILYDNISSDYMHNVIGSDDKEIVKKYLKENDLISMNVEISDVKYSENDYANVFVIKYFVRGREKIASIKESRPFKFTIDFSQNNMKSLLSSINLNRKLDDISYNVEILDSQENSVKLKLNIVNNSNDTYIYDFQNLNSIQLRYNNEYINMSMIANSPTVNYDITPGSSKSIEVLFAIPFNNQLKIDGLKFNNVKVNGNIISIEI